MTKAPWLRVPIQIRPELSCIRVLMLAPAPWPSSATAAGAPSPRSSLSRPSGVPIHRLPRLSRSRAPTGRAGTARVSSGVVVVVAAPAPPRVTAPRTSI